MRIANLASAAVLATGLLLAPGMARALTVNEGSPGIASDIEDLDVGGTLYDVVFVVDEFADNFYGGIYDFDNATDASAAVDAIVAALNGAGVNGVGPSDIQSDNEFRIGFMTLGSDVRTQLGANLSTFFTNEGTEPVGGGFRTTFADFTAVPEPGTLWLLGPGLIGLIGVRRSKKA